MTERDHGGWMRNEIRPMNGKSGVGSGGAAAPARSLWASAGLCGQAVGVVAGGAGAGSGGLCGVWPGDGCPLLSWERPAGHGSGLGMSSKLSAHAGAAGRSPHPVACPAGDVRGSGQRSTGRGDRGRAGGHQAGADRGGGCPGSRRLPAGHPGQHRLHVRRAEALLRRHLLPMPGGYEAAAVAACTCTAAWTPAARCARWSRSPPGCSGGQSGRRCASPGRPARRTCRRAGNWARCCGPGSPAETMGERTSGAVNWLLSSAEPAVRLLARRDLLGRDVAGPAKSWPAPRCGHCCLASTRMAGSACTPTANGPARTGGWSPWSSWASRPASRGPCARPVRCWAG